MTPQQSINAIYYATCMYRYTQMNILKKINVKNKFFTLLTSFFQIKKNALFGLYNKNKLKNRGLKTHGHII